MKDNAWNRALLSTQIKQTQRDIMRTKLLGTYESKSSPTRRPKKRREKKQQIS
jgi:hypothetical protein